MMTNPFDVNDGDIKYGCGGKDDDDSIDADMAFLDSMDIDNDFNIWGAFHSSVVVKSTIIRSGGTRKEEEGGPLKGHEKVAAEELTEAEPNDSHSIVSGEEEEREPPLKGQEKAEEEEMSEAEMNDVKKWAARVAQKEVYGLNYRPVPRETKEMSNLALFLGVPNKASNKNEIDKKTRKKKLDVGLVSCSSWPSY